MPFLEKDPLSEPVRNIVYGQVDRGNGKYDWMRIEATDNGNGLASLKTTSGGGGGSSNTVAPTNAGTTASTANPIQGVTGGVPVPISGTVSGPLPTPVFGQTKITTTSTAVQLGSNALQNGLTIKAGINNAAVITVGISTSLTTVDTGSGNGYALLPGEAISIAVSNSNVLWINGTANDYIYFAGN